ncbi:MAG: high-affinity nickel-transport family protein [Gemmatimonadales bacterium]
MARALRADAPIRSTGPAMNSLGIILALGFFLGMRHATDPDHVIAVSTIVTRHRRPRQAALIGLAWGIGHTLTILAVGAGIILLGWVVPARVGLSLEFSVGLMLVLLGALTLRAGLRGVREQVLEAPTDDGVTHAHPHRHGDYIHTHPHHHHPDAHPHRAEQTPLARLDRQLGGLRVYQLVRPLVVGIVHGLAGSAAVALLILATIGNGWWAIGYLVVFGLGTVVGMMLVTALIAWPFAYAGARVDRAQRALRLASGAVSLLFGLVLAYRIGIVGGLFGDHPTWTPH